MQRFLHDKEKLNVLQSLASHLTGEVSRHCTFSIYENDVSKFIMRFVLSLWPSSATKIFKAFPTISHSSTLFLKPRIANPRYFFVPNIGDHLSSLRLNVHTF